MHRYVKRPVTIEAFQMTRERRTDNTEWPEWLNRAWSLHPEAEGSVFPVRPGTSDGEVMIRTLEGVHKVSWNDWIIRGLKGELYPCKPEIFAASYDAADDDAPQDDLISVERDAIAQRRLRVRVAAPPHVRPLHNLSFDVLRKTNLARCEDAFHPLDSWSPTDWATALAGELGELCNLLKKQRRGDWVNPADLVYEVADTATYLDLLAARLGIDLGAAIARKFNMVSEARGSVYRLPERE